MFSSDFEKNPKSKRKSKKIIFIDYSSNIKVIRKIDLEKNEKIVFISSFELNIELNLKFSKSTHKS